MGILCVGCKDTKESSAAPDDKTTTPKHDELLDMLQVNSVESDIWLLDFSGVIGEGHQFKLQHKPFGGKVAQNRIPAASMLKIGDIFFKNEPGKDRFKLKAVETMEEEGQFGPVQRKRAIVEDLSEQKNGKTYEVKYQTNKKERSSSIQYDHIVVFRFDSNENEEHEFRVAEYDKFSLPPGEEDKPYKLLEVKSENSGTAKQKAVSVTLQYEVDGELKTREIPIP